MKNNHQLYSVVGTRWLGHQVLTDYTQVRLGYLEEVQWEGSVERLHEGGTVERFCGGGCIRKVLWEGSFGRFCGEVA